MSQHGVVQLARENPALFTKFLDYFETSDPAVWSRLMVKPEPWPVSPAVVDQWQEGLAHGAIDKLTVAAVHPGEVVAEVACWFKQVSCNVLVSCMVNALPDSLLSLQASKVQQIGMDAAVLAENKEKRAAITIMHADEQHMPATHSFGNCWALAQSSRGHFARRTSITEHTRTVPFSFIMPGAKANKCYAYHVMAFGTAYISLDQPDMFRNEYIPSLSELMALTQSKAADSPTLCHACGNAFCCNPGHLYVASKHFNHLQEKCHHFLHMMTKEDQVQGFQQSVCALFHEKPADQQQPCWTNNYKLGDLDHRRVTFSELTHEEILEGELPL